jgi:hypothetical protein
MSLQFDWILDNECFNMLFMEYGKESQNLIQFDDEIKVPSYRTIDECHLSKTGFITEIIVKIQKILKHKLKDENLTLDLAIEKIGNSVYKTNIKDQFKFIDLWTIQFDGNINFDVEFFTLKKVQSK